jgi:hypothetical protein
MEYVDGGTLARRLEDGALPLSLALRTAIGSPMRWITRPRRAALAAGVAGAMLSALLFTAMPSVWPTPAIAEYRQVTDRRGAVSSARFAPDGQSFVYSASWEGQPFAAFLGRPESPDVRDLQLEDARILSISQAGDMAVLFGPQNIVRAFGVRTLARIPMAGGARRDLLRDSSTFGVQSAAATLDRVHWMLRCCSSLGVVHLMLGQYARGWRSRGISSRRCRHALGSKGVLAMIHGNPGMLTRGERETPGCWYGIGARP